MDNTVFITQSETIMMNSFSMYWYRYHAYMDKIQHFIIFLTVESD